MNQRKVYYGWIIVAVSFINLGVAFGIWYSFSVFFVAVLKEFEWSRAATAGVFSCFILVHSLAAILIGTLLDRFGARIIIPAGSCIVALGLFASSRIDTLWEFYLWYGVLTSVGICAIGFITHGILLPKWFEKKRGLAIGIAMAGIGVGMQVIVPAVQFVIDYYSWRTAYALLALSSLLIILPLNLIVQRSDPAEIGEKPDGKSSADNFTDDSKNISSPKKVLFLAPVAMTIQETLKTRQFWFLGMTFLVTPLAVQGTLIHQVASVVDRGFTPAQGAFFFGLAGIMGSAGKILFGYLSDVIGREKAFTIGLASAFLGIVSLMALTPQCTWMLFSFAIFFGLGYGSIAPIFPSRAADLFLGPHFGKTLGILSLGGGIGGAAGVWLSGKIFDLTSSYQTSFAISLCAIIVAIILFRFTKRPRSG
ncbi:MAG: MFS transporter [Syntrophales bacterium]|jgi:MFS family permease|nr:MFS transporter [Syntrophales bacterium]MDY0045094.1 MFS transporter [Syntrophales bacterium]